MEFATLFAQEIAENEINEIREAILINATRINIKKPTQNTGNASKSNPVLITEIGKSIPQNIGAIPKTAFTYLKSNDISTCSRNNYTDETTHDFHSNNKTSNKHIREPTSIKSENQVQKSTIARTHKPGKLGPEAFIFLDKDDASLPTNTNNPLLSLQGENLKKIPCYLNNCEPVNTNHVTFSGRADFSDEKCTAQITTDKQSLRYASRLQAKSENGASSGSTKSSQQNVKYTVNASEKPPLPPRPSNIFRNASVSVSKQASLTSSNISNINPKPNFPSSIRFKANENEVLPDSKDTTCALAESNNTKEKTSEECATYSSRFSQEFQRESLSAVADSQSKLSHHLEAIEEDNETTSYQRACEEEIERMKNREICNSVSFFYVFKKNVNQLAVYASNENVLRVLQSDNRESEFPIYTCMIKYRFKLGIERKESLDLGRVIFECPSDLHDLVQCSEEILSYLSNEDLKKCYEAVMHKSA